MHPPVVPASFWDHAPLKNALGTWHMGRAVRAYRHHPHHGPRPLSQELVASWLGVTQTQLSRIESGPPVTDLDRLISWSRTLGIPRQLLWFRLPSPSGLRPPAVQIPPPRASLAPSLPPAIQQATVAPLTALPVASDDDPDMAALNAFRAADRQVGGGHLYPTVTGYLQSSLAPRLFGAQAAGDDGRVFTAAGGFTEMAGWMAHDAGHDLAARQHFRRSLDLARTGGDSQLSAHVYASLSHLALHTNQPKDAIDFARQGHTVLAEASPTPAVEARLLAMEARGLAVMKNAAACTGVLRQAEKVLEQPPTEEPSPWVSPFDAGSLASETARCMHELGHLDEAERQARQIIEIRASRTRSQAFATLLLIRVLVAQGRADEACHLVAEVLNATQALSSHLVTRQLQEIHSMLTSYRTSPAAAEVLPYLASTVRQRLGLYGWLTSTSAD